jgi:phosphoribosylformimino-5-aminoimidazole carboxamide ribonucleotide (ProFAR) isomerase
MIHEIVTKIRESASVIFGAIVHFPRRDEVDFVAVEKLKAAVPKEIFFAVSGGVTKEEDIARLDKLGAHALSGSALASGTLDLGLAIAAPLVTDRPDGLFSTIVADESGIFLFFLSFLLLGL